MRFDRNIYMRLYHIAFFIPDALIPEEKEDVFSIGHGFYELCPDHSFCKKITKNLMFANLNEVKSGYITAAEFMEISPLEKNLFYICLAIYEKLSLLFSSYEDAFKQNQKKELYMEYNLEEAPEGFYQFVSKESQNSISAEMIKENTFEVFSTLKAACYFYCKFSPSYSLYGCSYILNEYKSEISILKRTRKDVALFFGNFPTNRKGYLITALLNVADSLLVYLKCKNLVKERDKDEGEKKIWDETIETLFFSVVYNCINVSELLSAKPIFTYQEIVSHIKDNLIEKNEFTRRKRISDSQNNRLSERQRQIENHKKRIVRKMGLKNVSKRKACKDYFDEHKSELKSIHINSPRTLENICSSKEPNKQRSAFSNMAFLKPYYSPAVKKKIKEITRDYLLESENLPDINIFKQKLINRSCD